MEFKEKLQLLRTNMKLSQEELANRLDISRQSITKWENGQSFPDIQNLIQLSEIFKVSIDRLVKETHISRVKMKSCRHSLVPTISVMKLVITCIWILTLAGRNS